MYGYEYDACVKYVVCMRRPTPYISPPVHAELTVVAPNVGRIRHKGATLILSLSLSAPGQAVDNSLGGGGSGR